MPVRKQKSSVSFVLVSQMMGASLLAIPYIFSQLGAILSVLSFIIVYAVVLILLPSFTEAIHYTQSLSYRQATHRICGKRTCQLLNICLIVSYYGFCTGYVIISSRAVYQFMINVFKMAAFNIIYVKTIISFLIILPLTLIRKMSILSKISSISSLIIGTTVISIIILFSIKFSAKTVCGNGQYQMDIIPQDSILNIILKFLMYIPSIQSNFGSYNTIPSLLNSIQGPPLFRKKTVKLATRIAATVGSLFFISVGYLGAIMFGASIKNNIFDNIGLCKFIYFDILSLLYGIVVIIAYPLAIFPIKETILLSYKLSMDTMKGYCYSIGIDILFILLSFLLSVLYEDIVVIFAIFACISGFVYIFLLPFIFALQLPKLRAQNLHLDVDDQPSYTLDPLIVPLLGHIMPVNNARKITEKIFGRDEQGVGDFISMDQLSLFRSRSVMVESTLEGPLYQKSLQDTLQFRSIDDLDISEPLLQQENAQDLQAQYIPNQIDIPISKLRKVIVYSAIVGSSLVCLIGAVMNIKKMIVGIAG